MKKKNLILNDFGYYSVLEVPSQEELREYYANVYYQEAKGAYQRSYSEKELQFIQNELNSKQFILRQYIKEQASFLDIGCGEGWALKYFKEQGLDVLGLDFSSFGCETFNPDCLPHLVLGDIYENIGKLLLEGRQFDIIWMSNLLEHVINPLQLLEDCNKMITTGGVLVVIVPNDFSRLQQYLLENQYVNDEFWVVIPDHLSYFNRKGLCNVAEAAGWKLFDMLGDFPIDFSLLNENTNYIKDKQKGRSVHLQRVEIENLLYSISLETTVKYYRALGEMGLGRKIIAFFVKKNGNE